MSKYIDLAKRIADDMNWGTGLISDVCRWLDAHPEITAHPTITYSESLERTRGMSKEKGHAWVLGFISAGGDIVPDPKPTNAEKLAAIFRTAPVVLEEDAVHGDEAIRAWAEWLDERGVKADG